MEESNVSFEQLEKHLGWQPAQLEKLLDGKIEINIEMTLDLADTWGNSVEYWLNVQKNSSFGIFCRTVLPYRRSIEG